MIHTVISGSNVFVQITEERCLNSTRHMFVSERAWSFLADRFATTLSDHDLAEMSSIQSSIDAWHVTLGEFDNDICAREEDVRHQLMLILDEIRCRLEPDKWYGIKLFFILIAVQM